MAVRTAVDGSYRARVIHSPAGEATATFQLPFSRPQLQSVLTRVGRSMRNLSMYDLSDVPPLAVEQEWTQLEQVLRPLEATGLRQSLWC